MDPAPPVQSNRPAREWNRAALGNRVTYGQAWMALAR